jgi:hypothetical protein
MGGNEDGGTTTGTGQRGTRRNDNGEGTTETIMKTRGVRKRKASRDAPENFSLFLPCFLRVREKARKNKRTLIGLRQALKRLVITRNGCSDYLDLSQGEQFVPAMPTSDCITDARHIHPKKRSSQKQKIRFLPGPFIHSSIFVRWL